MTVRSHFSSLVHLFIRFNDASLDVKEDIVNNLTAHYLRLFIIVAVELNGEIIERRIEVNTEWN